MCQKEEEDADDEEEQENKEHRTKWNELQIIRCV